jgi:hypothetical protein
MHKLISSQHMDTGPNVEQDATLKMPQSTWKNTGDRTKENWTTWAQNAKAMRENAALNLAGIKTTNPKDILFIESEPWRSYEPSANVFTRQQPCSDAGAPRLFDSLIVSVSESHLIAQ